MSDDCSITMSFKQCEMLRGTLHARGIWEAAGATQDDLVTFRRPDLASDTIQVTIGTATPTERLRFRSAESRTSD